MSRATDRRPGFVLWAWALSPLATALLLILNGPRTHGGSLSGAEPVSWSLRTDGGATTMPTPDAPRTALRDELPSGLVLYQRLGSLVVHGPGETRDRPALSVELVAPGGEVLFQALRSPFFGAADLPLAAALSASLANENGPSRLLVGLETAAGVSLKLDGGQPYAAASLIGGIDVVLPTMPVR